MIRSASGSVFKSILEYEKRNSCSLGALPVTVTHPTNLWEIGTAIGFVNLEVLRIGKGVILSFLLELWKATLSFEEACMPRRGLPSSFEEPERDSLIERRFLLLSLGFPLHS